MRNHKNKARDMARSVLPSTARKGARKDRAYVRSRERANERQLLHELRRTADVEDFDGCFAWQNRRDMADLVESRRAADKVGPLLRWAERTIQRDPRLATSSPADREVHFRKLLPPGLIGKHAITHLRWVLDDGDDRRRVNRSGRGRDTDVELVEAVIAAGRHGDLNRRIRSTIAPVVVQQTRLPAKRVVDDEHPAPGLLLPVRWVKEYRRRRIRFLGGAHDVDAFVQDASQDVIRVVRLFHADLMAERDQTQ